MKECTQRNSCLRLIIHASAGARSRHCQISRLALNSRYYRGSIITLPNFKTKAKLFFEKSYPPKKGRKERLDKNGMSNRRWIGFTTQDNKTQPMILPNIKTLAALVPSLTKFNQRKRKKMIKGTDKQGGGRFFPTQTYPTFILNFSILPIAL